MFHDNCTKAKPFFGDARNREGKKKISHDQPPSNGEGKCYSFLCLNLPWKNQHQQWRFNQQR